MKKNHFTMPKYLRNKIRQCWLWSDVRRQALKNARVAPGKSRCHKCKKKKPEKTMCVDHVIPFAPPKGFRNLRQLGAAIERLYDLRNHQVLCKPCHISKTRRENIQRRK